MHNFDTLIVCCTFCTLLVLNVVWSLIQGLQICISLDLTGYVAMCGLLEASKFEKQVILPATLPNIESDILGCKNIFSQKNLVVR